MGRTFEGELDISLVASACTLPPPGATAGREGLGREACPFNGELDTSLIALACTLPGPGETTGREGLGRVPRSFEGGFNTREALGRVACRAQGRDRAAADGD